MAGISPRRVSRSCQIRRDVNIDKKIGAQWVQALLSAPKISAENEVILWRVRLVVRSLGQQKDDI